MLVRRAISWAASFPLSNSPSLMIPVSSLSVEKARRGMLVVTDLGEMKLELPGVAQRERYSGALSALKYLATESRCPVLVLAGQSCRLGKGKLRQSRSSLYDSLWQGDRHRHVAILMYVSCDHVLRCDSKLPSASRNRVVRRRD